MGVIQKIYRKKCEHLLKQVKILEFLLEKFFLKDIWGKNSI